MTNACALLPIVTQKSPYVAQGQMFHLSADLLPHKLFCRGECSFFVRECFDKSVSSQFFLLVWPLMCVLHAPTVKSRH